MATKKNQAVDGDLREGFWKRDYWIRLYARGKRYSGEVGSLAAAKTALEFVTSKRVRHIAKFIGAAATKRSPSPSLSMMPTSTSVGTDRSSRIRHCSEVQSYAASIRQARSGVNHTQEVLDWLDEQAEEHEWSDTTRNRYVAAFSLIYSVASPDGDQEADDQALWQNSPVPGKTNSRVRSCRKRGGRISKTAS